MAEFTVGGEDESASFCHGEDPLQFRALQFETLREMRKEGILTDVTLTAATAAGSAADAVDAHKVVLAASSEYFRTLFKGAFSDGSNSCYQIPELPDGQVLASLVDYFYTGTIPVLMASNFEISHFV